MSMIEAWGLLTDESVFPDEEKKALKKMLEIDKPEMLTCVVSWFDGDVVAKAEQLQLLMNGCTFERVRHLEPMFYERFKERQKNEEQKTDSKSVTDSPSIPRRIGRPKKVVVEKQMQEKQKEKMPESV